MGDVIRVAGEAVIGAPADQLGATLLAQLRQFVPTPYRIETGIVTDSEGRRTQPLSALICLGGQLVGADVGQAVLPAESVAVAFDVTHTLELNGLAAAYSRVAAAKALTKTAPAPGNQAVEPTLGVIFAVDTTVPLEDLAAELERLNARTPSDHWPDAVVIATKGQIAYVAQFVGDKSITGLLLPPSPGASRKTQFPIYALLLISASWTGTFNLAMHMVLGHLVRWSPRNVPPEYMTVLDDVPRQGITWTGYQYNLAGQLCPVPRECYNDRALPPKSVALFSRGAKEQLGAMCFIPWQDGGVILLRGKLPLEGMLVFLGGVIDNEAFRNIQKVTRDDLQISSVMPIKERQYGMLLRNIQQRGGLDVKENHHQFVVQKFADEGTNSPFMARIFYGQMRMADALGAEREPFLKAHRILMTTLMEIRDAAKDVAKIWKDHTRKIDEGSIVESKNQSIHITENVDRQLGRLVSEFLNGATRSFKDRMQQAARTLSVDIGCLYQKQSKYEQGLADLEKTDSALADYLREARKWGNSLVDTRNNLDHGDWTLQSAAVADVGGRIVVSEPTIHGTPVTAWVNEMTDRILCFVEDVIAHGIQKRLIQGITLAEIPVGQRAPDMPLRFQNTVVGSGFPTWQICYHTSQFDET
ncbi:DUF6602 domain-containing protein [Paraburkholderia terrae]|uniref:Uncharacterized protein n=1 Tax=Paraburkholderia terrae TaxID=311230 RepID=A0A2I8EZP7_9BURK|nr:hypothetical protein [Paraburkholderia terrae]AUT64969.1 hypothetical protein C2L65_35830 [Paraburkholderia terrae]